MGFWLTTRFLTITGGPPCISESNPRISDSNIQQLCIVFQEAMSLLMFLSEVLGFILETENDVSGIPRWWGGGVFFQDLKQNDETGEKKGDKTYKYTA